MRIDFDGHVLSKDFEFASGLLAKFFHHQGIDRLSQLTISFTGWRGDKSCQIVNQEGFLRSVIIDWDSVSKFDGDITLDLPLDFMLRDSPDEKDWSPLAVMMGRDE